MAENTPTWNPVLFNENVAEREHLQTPDRSAKSVHVDLYPDRGAGIEDASRLNGILGAGLKILAVATSDEPALTVASPTVKTPICV